LFPLRCCQRVGVSWRPRLALKLSNPHLQLNTPLPNGYRLVTQQAEGPGLSLCRQLVGNLGDEVLHPFVLARDFGFAGPQL
jgi:hypothetical protein